MVEWQEAKPCLVFGNQVELVLEERLEEGQRNGRCASRDKLFARSGALNFANCATYHFVVGAQQHLVREVG